MHLIKLGAMAVGIMLTLPIYSSQGVEASQNLASEGIIVARDNTSDYRLNDFVLRQEIIGTIMQADEKNRGQFYYHCDDVYEDVSSVFPNDWACEKITKARKYGFISHQNTKAYPERNISKSEALAMVVYLLGYDVVTSEGVQIRGANEWQRRVIGQAYSEGIITQITHLDPNALATRGEVFLWIDIARQKADDARMKRGYSFLGGAWQHHHDILNEPCEGACFGIDGYSRFEVVTGAHGDTFEPINEYFAKDKNHVYEYGNKLQGFNGSDYTPIEGLDGYFVTRNGLYFYDTFVTSNPITHENRVVFDGKKYFMSGREVISPNGEYEVYCNEDWQFCQFGEEAFSRVITPYSGHVGWTKLGKIDVRTFDPVYLNANFGFGRYVLSGKDLYSAPSGLLGEMELVSSDFEPHNGKLRDLRVREASIFSRASKCQYYVYLGGEKLVIKLGEKALDIDIDLTQSVIEYSNTGIIRNGMNVYTECGLMYQKHIDGEKFEYVHWLNGWDRTFLEGEQAFVLKGFNLVPISHHCTNNVCERVSSHDIHYLYRGEK